MDKCEAHSGVCANIENIERTCKDHRGQFDAKLDKIEIKLEAVDKKFDAQRTLLVTVLVGVVINLGLFLIQNSHKLFAFYWGYIQ